TAVVPFPARPHSIPELQAAAFTPEARVRKTAGYVSGPFSSVEFKALPGLDLHPVVVFESVFVGHIHIACTGRHAADLVLDCPIYFEDAAGIPFQAILHDPNRTAPAFFDIYAALQRSG